MPYEYTLADGAGGGVGGGSAHYGTVLEICNDVAEAEGLGTQTAIYASVDPNIVQLRALLKQEGRRLAMEREWKQLVTEHAFSTVSGTAAYALPADFSRMANQTAWNRTTDRRFVPFGAQAWQYLKATSLGSALMAIFRPRAATFEIHPAPSAVEAIAFEYLSNYWLASSGSIVGDKDKPTADTDTVLLDPALVVAALRLAWRKAKGFDATAALADYERTFALSAGANAGPAPTLRLDRPGSDDWMRLNVPETGYGT